MFCSKCGAATTADSAFCTSCGAPQARAAIDAPGAISVPANVGVAGFSAGRGQFLFAGFWLRFVAYLIDGLIVSVGIFGLFIPIAVLTGAAAHLNNLENFPRNGGQMDPAVIAALISVIITFAGVALLITWLYHAYFESSSWQATPGKRVLSLYVTDLSGQPISFLHATGRHFSKIITGLIPLGLGYIMAGFTERRQALHDMIAGTLVLRR
ncbi:MAG TPA: RDD family protein [Candidatus Acidoferrum sp.]